MGLINDAQEQINQAQKSYDALKMRCSMLRGDIRALAGGDESEESELQIIAKTRLLERLDAQARPLWKAVGAAQADLANVHARQKRTGESVGRIEGRLAPLTANAETRALVEEPLRDLLTLLTSSGGYIKVRNSLTTALDKMRLDANEQARLETLLENHLVTRDIF